MTTTGYSDIFGRTVAAGLGVATSGQTYTLSGVASQFSVAPNTASIAVASAGDKLGYVDRLTQGVDITAQVALSAIPASNLATVGFVAELSSTNNYYNATMMVATGGAVSLRFSKMIGGGLSTISTTLVTGLTYVANTFYNLRYSIVWSQALQTNVMSLKLWALGATPPGGWMATTTDASLTQYTSGTQVGIMGRDESTVLGTITTKHQNVNVNSYLLPMPAATDPMCADPAVTYPKQTALQSLAVAADAAVQTLDPLASLAGLFPRVRISNSLVPLSSSASAALPFSTTEFNIGTPTNLGYNNQALLLPPGIWLLALEVALAEQAAADIVMTIIVSNSAPNAEFSMRSSPVVFGDAGVGGTGHASILTYSTDPTTPLQCTAFFNASTVFATYTIKYIALSAIKVSDYFV